MNKLIISFLICLCTMTGLHAQKIGGKIVDSNGDDISYVNIGVVDSGIGTIADRDGNFTLTLPNTLAAGTILTVTHISYVPLEIPVERIGEYGGSLTKLVFELTEKEYKIAEVSITTKKKKPKKLAGRGIKYPVGEFGFISIVKNEKAGIKTGKLAYTMIDFGIESESDLVESTLFVEIEFGTGTKPVVGSEIGGIVDVEKEFVVRHFELPVKLNRDDSTKVRINIYRVEGERIWNILNRPVYLDFGKIDSPTFLIAEPAETIVLEKGKYFVSMEFVETSDGRGTFFSTYLKPSFYRKQCVGRLEKIPFNPGVVVYGYEVKR